jgi:hypothetical protein
MNKLYTSIIENIINSIDIEKIFEGVGTLDVSIKHLKKEINNDKKALNFVNKRLYVEEKIDGTKLVIIRTDKDDKDKWYNNWIVAYKGNILYPEEFSYLSDKEKENIKKSSIGISQYAIVFDRLRSINASKIPKNTGFSLEFAQNKETLTRTYNVTQALFLRSYAPVKYYTNKGFVTTSLSGAEVTDKKSVDAMAKMLGVYTFPVWLSGYINSANNFRNAIKNPLLLNIFDQTTIDYSEPMDIVAKFSNMVIQVESSLGGLPEGVVITTDDGKLYKVTQEDQYSVDVRGAKKDLYRMEPEKEKVYQATIREIAKQLISKIDLSQPMNMVLGKYNELVKKVNLDKIKHEKKNNINKLDDLMLTGKFIIQQRTFIGTGTKTLGIVPMAGKPVHAGHWKLIELAAKENERVMVYVSEKGRIKPGEFPIEGGQMIEVWNDILTKYLPDNVSIKFVESPVSNVRYALLDLESDPEDAPTVSIYSDAEDIQNYDLAEFNAKYPGLGSMGKIKLRGVERTSTVDISGTKMRSFLLNNDKTSFFNYLPQPISNEDKEKIWNIFKGSQLQEGGWRSTETQSTVITPSKIVKIIDVFNKFIDEFNQYSGLPPIKSNGPVGSALYYKNDLGDESVTYGDADIQVIYPVETNDKALQISTKKLYDEKVRDFISTKKPSYILPNPTDKDYGSGYLIFVIDGENIQVDLVKSFTVTADWVKVRTTPERGLKGFVTGMLMSAFSEVLNVSVGSNANPHFNLLNGLIVGSPLKKGTTQHYLNPDEVYLDIVKYYGKMAGKEVIDDTNLKGRLGLNPTDPRFKTRCEDIVAIANTLDANGIFEVGVIRSKDGDIIRSRQQFIDKIKKTFIEMMEEAKTAKKFDKATTTQAFSTIEKVKKHADIGIDVATQLIKEMSQSQFNKIFRYLI